MSHLLSNLLLFGRVLRGLGLAVDPGRMVDLVQALEHVGLARRDDVRAAAQALLVRRHEDLALFEAAFDAFWRKPTDGATSLDLRALGERRRFKRSRCEPSAAPDVLPGDDGRAAPDEPPRLRAQLTWSARELLRHKDFAELSADELRQVEALIAASSWRLRERRTRRLRPGRGARLDLRRTLRHALRQGGEILTWRRRAPRTRPRPLVVIADISGSMERYTRLLLLFMYALADGLGARVEAFVFGTRLTRVTRELRGRAVGRALDDVARAVPDWSGGTRMGDALRAFNFEWGRRVLGHGAIVLLISDGWDRGDPELLRDETARLQRNCQRLIWLNPLVGTPGYEPLTRGLQAALPYVDDFLPARHVASLDDLARRLEALDARRPVRRQVPAARALGAGGA